MTQPRAALRRLLGEVWPRLDGAIPLAASWGAVWEEMSQAFTIDDAAGDPIAHVGVMRVPLVVAGRSFEVAGFHAVCTAPHARRRGHAHVLVERAIEACEREGLTTQVLFAVKAGFYEDLGFRPIGRRRFGAIPWPHPEPGPGRRVELFREHDRVRETYDDRVLLSSRFAAPRSTDLALLNIAIAGDLEVYDVGDHLVVCRRRGPQLEVADIVGASVPDVDTTVSALPFVFDSVVLDFSPDQLVGAPQVPPTPVVAGDTLMVRGDFPETDLAICVPPLARW